MKKTRFNRRRLLLVLCGFVALFVMTVIWLWSNPRILVVESASARVDAIVVLGGDFRGRTARAAEVYQEQPCRWVIVSGSGDFEAVRQQLELHGVPPSVILVEPNSTSTFENARFSTKLMRDHSMTNVAVVTSWYHSRRALGCFKQAAPEIQFISRPTRADFPISVWKDGDVRARILSEHVKLIYYRIVHGVSSW